MTTTASANRGPRVNAVNYTMLVLATIAVILRFWARYIASKAGFWWDDWLSLTALPFVWSIVALSLYWVSIGLGKHISQVPEPLRPRLALLLLADNLLYNTGLTLVKMSVVLFYVRIFRSVASYRMAFWVTASIVVGWFFAIQGLAIFHCIPIHKQWNPTIPGHCLDSSRTFLGATIPNILIDFIILVLPMPMLWRLNIKKSRKIGLVGVFAAGYCVLILSCIRLASIIGIGDMLSKDISWNLAYPQELITVELSVALISSCLPSIFNLVQHAIRRFLPKLFSRLSASEKLGGPAGSHIGAVGNPIDDTGHRGFMQLQSGGNNTGGSSERLYDGMGAAAHYTTAYPGNMDDNQRREDPQSGIPLYQIHVRDDVHVDALSGFRALEQVVA